MSLICRTCLENVEKTCYFYIDTFDNSGISNTIPKDVLQLCVPELDLYISEQPGICTECLNMFETFYKFKNRCIASEEKILTYIKKNRIDANCKISLKSVLLDEPSTPQSEESEGPQEAIPSNNEEALQLLSCEECSFVTMEQDKLLRHKCLSISAPDKYKCPYCDYSTTRRYRLSYHINAKHTKANWHECSQCEYKTTDSNSLRRHRKVVHFAGAPSFACALCDFTSVSEVALQRHRVGKHGPIMQQCALCSYQTKDKSNFRKHLYIHGDKPRKCTKCSYQCVSPYQLERHYKKIHV